MKTFKFCPQTNEWKSIIQCSTGQVPPSNTTNTLTTDKLLNEFGLKIGTFNVLFDLVPFFLKPILRARERHLHTIDMLKRENFDILILNEVTGRFLKLLENDEFFRNEYYFSDVLDNDQEEISEKTQNKSLGKRMGNLILSKFAPDRLEMESVNKSRGFIYAFYTPIDSESGERVEEKSIAIVAAHTSAYTHNDKVRKEELTQLVNSKLLDQCKNVVVLGDLNLHSEHEDQTIEDIKCRDLWKETRNDGHLRGYTFDALNNSLIQMLFMNFEKRRMRLDRIIVNSSSLLGCNSKVELFGHQPISTFKRQGISNRTVETPYWFTVLRNLGVVKCSSDDYLFCSDHFGLKTSLVLCESDQELSNITQQVYNQDESAINEFKEDSLTVPNQFQPSIRYYGLIFAVGLIGLIGYGFSAMYKSLN